MSFEHLIFTLLILAGCQENTSTYIEGPELIGGNVQSLLIESLENGAKSGVIKDSGSIKVVEFLFSKHRWKNNNGKKFIPSYKFIITTNDNNHISYWVGANSDLNEPPCYKLCSGWRIFSSDNKNKMNKNIFKSLSASVDMFQLAVLLEKVENQPNNAPQPTPKNGAAEL